MAHREDLLIFNPAPRNKRRKNPMKDLSGAFLRLNATLHFDFEKLKHLTADDEKKIKTHIAHIEDILKKYGAII
jgi:hypothetical protein